MNNVLKSLIRPHYFTFKGYVSAGMESDKAAEIIFMNANENPYELPGLEGFNRYPEPQPKALLEAYAELYGVAPDTIMATRGADEAIALLTTVFCEPHKDSILICPPTFGVYDIDAKAAPVETLSVPLLEQGGTFALDVDDILKAINDRTPKLIFLCSPNNPTGTTFPRADILKIIEHAAGKAAVVIDEAYIEFSQQGSFVKHLGDYPHVIILRTLSKAYSLAGLRMGSMISADTDFIALMRANVMQTYPVPSASVHAAIEIAKPDTKKIADENIQKILAERARLQDKISALDSVEHIYPSDANFLLVHLENAHAFAAHCRAQGLYIRDFSQNPLTLGCLRISIGLPEENDRVIELLKGFS